MSANNSNNDLVVCFFSDLKNYTLTTINPDHNALDKREKYFA